MPEAPESHRPLDAVLSALGLQPHQVQAFDPDHPVFDAQRPLLVLAPQFEAARASLRERYPPHVRARALLDGAVSDAGVDALPGEAAAWLLPALPPEEDHRGLAGLRGLMERLFGPDGCPWDREQTHESLRRYFLEETYGLVDAIDRGDLEGLAEELGDVLAHIFMQTALAQQSGEFTLEDVLEHASAKFVRRHPHVFGEEESGSAEALLERWEQIKAVERAGRAEPESALGSVPLAAPALQRAQTLMRRALRAGALAPEDGPAAALPALLDGFGEQPASEDVGALLWAAVRLAQAAEVDAEEALRLASSSFAGRFERLEAEARSAGVPVERLDEGSRLAIWPGAPSAK
jgi:tetrapyrrole methylase family protein/MazG family protein